MQVLPADSTGIAHALSILRSGGIVAHATETCYGFACDVQNPDAVKRLFVIKKRPLDQPVSALFSSIEQAKLYVEWNEKAEELAKKYLPGPLTLILPTHKDAPHVIFCVPNALPLDRLHPLPPTPSPLRGRGGEGKENIFRSYRPSAIRNARQLRQSQTHAEDVLWDALRRDQFLNLHFRRQHPVGKYVVDFFCDTAALGIELDGSIHDQAEQRERDADRTLYMKEAGIRIVRFKNSDVEKDLGKVLSDIEKALSSAPPLPAPQGLGEGAGGRGCRSLGIRISSHSVAQQLVKEFGSPLSTSSANLHSQPNPYSAEDILKQFAEEEFQPDLILDSGLLPKNLPSTVINCTHAKGDVLRSGNLKL